MKQFQQFVFVFALILGSFSLSAQDFHKSLYNMMPLSVNPAYTGDFEGTIRIGGMMKSQGSTWNTPSLSVDVPIMMVRGRDWLSAGVALDFDRAGDLGLVTNRSAISVSYHLSLDKKGKNYFVLGYQFGGDSQYFAKDISPGGGNAYYGDGSDPLVNGGTIPNDRNNASKPKFNNIGAMYRSQVDKNTLINIGLSYNYIFRQNGSVINANTGGGGGLGGGNNTGSIDKSPSKFVLHGLVDRTINKKLSVHPSFIIRSKGTEGTEIMVQSMWGYLIRPDLDLRLRGGVGYDIDIGPVLLLGADYGDWRFGLSIEFPVTGLANTYDGLGGFEISASKIINVYKKPAIEPTICCPDL